VIHGRAPRAAGEAVLGAKTIEDLGVSIGDRVTIRPGALPERSVVVVGTAVLPAVGSFVSDRAGLRQGAFVVIDDEPTTDTASFVGTSLMPSTRQRFWSGCRRPASWGAMDAPPHLRPSGRSAEIVNVSELRSALLLGGARLSLPWTRCRSWCRWRPLARAASSEALGFGDARCRRRCAGRRAP
jgi:hypothetical protein